MIKIDVKPYCNNCEDFAPDVETFTGCCAGYKFVNHTIKCVNRDKCASMENHIRNEIETEKGE